MNYPIKTVCVYCGSAIGNNPEFMTGTIALGKALVARDITLVYGGASIGLMGVLANTVLENGGKAIGVIPEALDRKEVKNEDLTEIHIVNTMHERKAKMAALSDAFIALPGGYGTLDELIEVITWLKLGLQLKPVALYNIAGYFDPLLAMITRMAVEGFIDKKGQHLLQVGDSTETVLQLLSGFNPKDFVTPLTDIRNLGL